MKEILQVKVIKLTVIITYNCDLFESLPLGRMSFHQLLTIYYRDNGLAVSIREFHIKFIKLIVIIIYFSDFFESFSLGRMPFHQLLITYYRDIDVAVIIKEYPQVKNRKTYSNNNLLL